MGVALASCTVLAAGKPTFQIGADEMEMGVGIHGEPGRRRVKLGSADEIAAKLVGAILKDLSMPRGQEALLLVNGFGGTPMLELYVMVTAALKILQGVGAVGRAGPQRGAALGAGALSAFRDQSPKEMRLACRRVPSADSVPRTSS